jgi:hypothetical protein
LGIERPEDEGLRASALAGFADDRETLKIWRSVVRKAKSKMHRGAVVRNAFPPSASPVPYHLHTLGAHELAQQGVKMLAIAGENWFEFDDCSPVRRHDVPNPASITLRLDEDVRAALVTLLDAALEQSEGSRVIDHLPSDPWGDVEGLRRQVYMPLQGLEPSVERTAERPGLLVEPQDVGAINDVLDGLADSITRDAPWVALTTSEREVIARLVSRLRCDT